MVKCLLSLLYLTTTIAGFIVTILDISDKHCKILAVSDTVVTLSEIVLMWHRLDAAQPVRVATRCGDVADCCGNLVNDRARTESNTIRPGGA